MKVAVVHYWFYAMRGGERVVAEILRLFPHADLFTHLLIPERLDPLIYQRKITTTFIDRLPLARRLYQAYLPLMPAALRRLDLRDYDLIISSESGPAKGVRKRRGAVHVCYCHSPMRYIWDQQPVYLEQAGPAGRLFLRAVTPGLRRWDRRSATGVDRFIANSENVRQRIAKIYSRESTVIYPPVDLERFAPAPQRGDYFLAAGQSVPYKRLDLALAAFNQSGLPLKIAGSGLPAHKGAGTNIEFVHEPDDADFARLLAGARALVFPGEEDFGIVPVEAQAAGTPVIALGRGGALETITGLPVGTQPQPGIDYTGVFFDRPTPEALAAAVQHFIRHEGLFRPEVCQQQSRRFAAENFRRDFRAAIEFASGRTGGGENPLLNSGV